MLSIKLTLDLTASCHVRPKHFGNSHVAVFSLIIFNDSDHGSA